MEAAFLLSRSAKDTNTPDWFAVLDPIFTECCDNMVHLSSKAKDVLCSDSDEKLLSMDEDDDDESSIAKSKQSDEEQNDQDDDSPKTKKVKSEKKTVIRKNKFKTLKSKTFIMTDMVETIRESSAIQEKKK